MYLVILTLIGIYVIGTKKDSTLCVFMLTLQERAQSWIVCTQNASVIWKKMETMSCYKYLT